MKISIVICTYNRAKFIGEALDSLAKQTLDNKEFEIIIVNNNCSDNTQEICLQFIANHPEVDVNYVVESNQGLSFARNRGIHESKYELITYIDDDAYARPDFLEKIQSYFITNDHVVGIGGKVIARYEIEEPKWMNKYLHGFVSKMDKGDSVQKFKPKEFPVGCNMTYKKEILNIAGGFNNKLKWRADDKFIGLEVKKIKDEIYYVPEVVVEHTIDASRTSDDNFKKLSLKFGAEEAIRVKDLGVTAYITKAVEFLFKLVGSLVILVLFVLKGQLQKGLYTFSYRIWATRGFFSGFSD